ncbi:pentapeptide repeat-containing protein [Streptomyces chiangmaiensis]|uniref:pentapeptide repeat-containing protein n=1 Tax=Streptomyces chiangmaiensis TaxID=766497 RepID=UPI0031E70DD3
MAYRRQRVDEDGALREATRLHTERFTTAVSQLGDESAAVRLGGVHALAGLADDAPTLDLRQTCINVLCAYLRLPYTAEADLPTGDANSWHAYLALREVRHTIIRLIRDHLRLEPKSPHSWEHLHFDFTAVTFDGGDFSGATFSACVVDFSGATFSGGTVDFSDAAFSGGAVDFSDATFAGGVVGFDRATFSDGVVNFYEATFSGDAVIFDRARFLGGAVSFYEATFPSGAVIFDRARFLGGAVSFYEASFTGGTVDLSGATGEAPIGLMPPGTPLPPGLSLPPTW